MPVLASEQAFGAAFVFLVGGGFVLIALLPVSIVVTWLKGKRKTTALLGATLLILGVVWLSRWRWSLIEQVVFLAVPVALGGLVAAARLAKPGSWWFTRYKPEKREGAEWAHSSAPGRRLRRLTGLAAALSIVFALAGGALLANVIEDLTTTTWDELNAGVTLLVDADQPDELDLIASRAEAAGATAHIESRWIDFGDALTGSWGDCLQYDGTDRVWIELSPPTDEAVNELFEELVPIPGLVAVQSDLGNPETYFDVPGIGADGEDIDFERCSHDEVVAVLDPSNGEEALRAIADELAGRPGVIAVGVQTWRHEYLGYDAFPDLVACYGPRELRVLIEQDVDPSPLVAALTAFPAVINAFDQQEHFDEELEGSGEDPSTACAENQVVVSVEDDMTEAEAASLLAAARRIEGVAGARINMPSRGSFECDDCVQDGWIEIVRGDLELASMAAIDAAICGKPGVLGVSGLHESDSGCPALSMEVRIRAGDDQAIETIVGLVEERPQVHRASVLEPSDDSEEPLTVIGDRSPVVCDVEGERYWRIRLDLRPSEPPAVSDLIGEIEDVDGVVSISGNDSGIDIDYRRLCGYAVLEFWLGDVTEEQRRAVIGLLAAEQVWAMDIRHDDSHVGTDTGEVVNTEWSGRIYLRAWDQSRANRLRDLLLDSDGVVHVEVLTPDVDVKS